ncbi:MAG: deoxynucleoside kinase [Erysipelotrichaceae bacterium]
MKNSGLFIAVEGVIGVGKTTLAKLIEERYAFVRVKEIVDENPFLAQFYQNKEAYALQTEAFFLFNRIKQMEDLEQEVLRNGQNAISDYHIIKNLIFAGLTLNQRQLQRYKQVYNTLAFDLPTPDIIVYLHAQTDAVMERINKRNRSFEVDMDRKYIEDLAAEYAYYFHPHSIKHHFHGKLPLIVEIDSTNLNIVDNLHDRETVFTLIEEAIAKVERS